MLLKKREAVPIGPPGDAVPAGHRGRFATRDSSRIGSCMEQGELGVTRADHNGFGSPTIDLLQPENFSVPARGVIEVANKDFDMVDMLNG